MPGLSEEGKVIVRSDGTVVYTGKDIAYQLWKFGLLGKDFYYRADAHVCRRTRAVGIDGRAERRRRTGNSGMARGCIT